MKKVFGWIKNIFVNMAGNAVLDELETVAEVELEKYYTEDAEGATAVVKATYSLLPFLQRLAEKTKTQLDDKTVLEIKKELEEFAAKHNIQL